MLDITIQRNGIMALHFYAAPKGGKSKYLVLCIDKEENKSNRLFTYIIFRRDKIIARDVAHAILEKLNSIPSNISNGEKERTSY